MGPCKVWFVVFSFSWTPEMLKTVPGVRVWGKGGWSSGLPGQLWHPATRYTASVLNMPNINMLKADYEKRHRPMGAGK